MKTSNMYTRMRSITAIGFFGCAAVALTPIACGGIETVPFRQQPTAKHPAVPRITGERFTGCVQEYASQLDGRSIRVDGKVQVDPKGRIVDVFVHGVPNSAPDFAGCVSATLHDMAVPEWMLKLRPDQQIGATNANTIPAGNALANPIIVVELLIALAELVIEWEGVEVVFAVDVETVGWTVAAAQVAESTTQEKDKCTDYYEACVASKLFRSRGNHWNQSRCGICASICFDKNGVWPSAAGGETCVY